MTALRCQFNSDVEGEYLFNDYAYGLAVRFHPEGGKAGGDDFDKKSKYDDLLELTLPGHRAGTTLLFEIPSLIAWGCTNALMRDYALENVRMIPGAIETLSHVRRLMPVFLISTTYSVCVEPFAEMVGIPAGNLYCTRMSLDGYSLTPKEIALVNRLNREITGMPKLDWKIDEETGKPVLSREMRDVADRMDQIFLRDGELMKIPAYRQMVEEIKVAGGAGKAEAIQDSCRRTGNSLSRVCFTDDSITGARALGLVRQNGGLAMATNGNRYAVREAEIVCLLDNALPLAVLLTVFSRGGREAVLCFVGNWGWPAIGGLNLNKALIEQLHQAYPADLPQVEVSTGANLDRLVEQSEKFRTDLRKAVGGLG